MSKLIKNNTSVLFVILLFIVSISTFAISNAAANSMPNDNCHHCGTESACTDGGQSYGYSACDYDESYDPPDNCAVYGFSCGGPVPEKG
jgi:hypothetical protein